MKEIEIENELGLKVFINGEPDFSQIPQEIFDAFIAVLAEEICKNERTALAEMKFILYAYFHIHCQRTEYRMNG